ncbi:hypothetical protein ACFP9V_23250 [Deinococcus radiopugnans]|uniref:Secreted protein n=1 Tax=Deinococcus radiopugnans ATCC 19172 TaxID=585398 RepID=A0A5C4Y509_9DEIO|nr:hypothetical protein [Deinococcus radiopugnans]MBB6017166.1 hypothetical protein [Deinococcus radiopugnans ATCC 19172]TNM70613.1 hypothetical protein FHR04_11960 [Deinococcus radiopugnans ATCC 19172]
MKTKALLLSALILVPTAGAAAVQAAPTQEFRVQTNKALATPAQDFRVSYTGAALTSTPAIFAKSSLPQALSDEELDEVTGEFVANAVGAVTGGVAGALGSMAEQAAGGEKTNWTDVAKAAAGGAITGAFSPISSALAVSTTIKVAIAAGTTVGAAFKGK